MEKRNYFRDIEDLVDVIKKSKELGYKINLLIGAGCSVSAGIPSANEFVKIIAKTYTREYNKCEKRTYAECMKRLTPIERRDLISKYVNSSKINWAHLCIAQLIKNEYIDRVLTTNFDNLIVKACSIVQEYPAIYDLTSYTEFRTDLMLDKSILYLHGQYNGFILCNTESEVNTQKENIESIFCELNRNSVWIIVGYSGENDAIRDLLASQDVNENRLFWVGYNNDSPSKYVEEKILSEEKYSFFIKGYDADKFFISLTKSLNCFPPKIIEKPFTYLKNILDSIFEYKDSKPYVNTKINVHTKNVINKAIETYEKDVLTMAEHYINIGMISKLIELMEKNPDKRREIYSRYKNFFEERLGLCEKYIKEHDIKENYSNKDILDNLIECYEHITIGNYRSKDAIIDAFEKLDELYKIRFNIDRNLEILKNHINQLIEWANIYGVGDKEIVNILMKAQEMMLKSLNIKPNDVDMLISLGKLYKDLNTLFILKGNKKKAYAYYNKAENKFKQAINIDRNNSKLLINWADMCIRNLNKESKESIQKLSFALTKYSEAYDIKEDIKIKSACYFQLVELLEIKCNNEIFIKFLCDNIQKMSKELIDKNQIKFVLSRIEEVCKYDFKFKEQFLTEFWANNKDKINDSNNKERFIFYNELAYYLILENQFEKAEEFLSLADNKDNDHYLYLATMGLWYFNNPKIDLHNSEKNGLKYYEECLNKYKDNDFELYKCINEKMLLEYAKFCYYRIKDIEKSKSIIEQNNLGKACQDYGYSMVLKDIIKFKEIIYSEVAIE